MFSSSYDDGYSNNSAFSGYNDFTFDTNVGSSSWENEANDWIKDRNDDYDDYYNEKKKEQENRQTYYKLGSLALDSLYGSTASSSSSSSYSSTNSSKSSSENVSRSSSLSYSRRPSVQKEKEVVKTEKLPQIVENVAVAEVKPRIARVKPYHFEDEVISEKASAQIAYRDGPQYEPDWLAKLFGWCR